MKLLLQTFNCAIALAFSVSALAEEPAQLPDAAKKLQQAYRQSTEAAIKPIRDRYIADLKKLQEQSMKAGKLTDAVALNQEIASFAVSSIFGEWSSENMRLYIRQDHTASYTNGNTATWEIKGDELVRKRGNGVRR